MDTNRHFEFVPSAERLRKSEERRRRIAEVQIRQISELRQHITLHLGCSDCGAPAGQPCKPDYGCRITDRTVR